VNDPTLPTESLLCIKTPPELGDGTSSAIYTLDELDTLGETIRELVAGGDLQPGDAIELEVVAMSRAAFEALPNL
jgi:hypothetical protein